MTGRPIRSSPLVRRIAKENNLDLRQVAGSGSEGRINKDDILRHLGQLAASGTAPASPASIAAASDELGELVPMTKMRAIIGQRMVESLKASPPRAHHLQDRHDARIVHLREREQIRHSSSATASKLTYMPFIATVAAIEALRKFPIVNASLEGGSIRYHKHIHLGIAVALEWGLIVPVIRQAEQRSFVDLGFRAISDPASRARTKKLIPDETTGLHLHSHQLRHLRRRVRHAHHQSA